MYIRCLFLFILFNLKTRLSLRTVAFFVLCRKRLWGAYSGFSKECHTKLVSMKDIIAKALSEAITMGNDYLVPLAMTNRKIHK